MAIVTVNQGESIESALRRFKRKVMTEEIIKDAKKHAFFIPPGQKAKLKSALAVSATRKKAACGSRATKLTPQMNAAQAAFSSHQPFTTTGREVDAPEFERAR
jgi:small subunit ribosomal protein S21